MNKTTYQLQVFEGGTLVFSWEAEDPFVAIHHGEVIRVPGTAKRLTINSVSHEFEENKRVGDGPHLIQRTIVQC